MRAVSVLVVVLASAFLVTSATAAPPSGYACSPGTPKKGVGCTCPAGYASARDADDNAICAVDKTPKPPENDCARIEAGVWRAYAGDLSADEQKKFRAAFAPLAVQRCTHGDWKADQKRCLAGAATEESAYECLEKLAPVQRGGLDADAARLHPVDATVVKSELKLKGAFVFAQGSATMSDASAPLLARIVKIMTDEPGLRIEVQGHVDDAGDGSGDGGSAQRLSQTRADAVRTALIKAGVAGDRVAARGLGATRPIASNGSAWGRSKNRRIEIAILASPTAAGSNRVFFERGASAIQPKYTPVLDEIVAVLDRRPTARLRVTGHADNTEADAANLGTERATAVHTYLVGKGIAAQRIEVFTAGAREPIGNNATLDGRAMNRRAELFVGDGGSRAAACDGAALEQTGNDEYGRGNYASALALFERALACSPNPTLVRSTFLAACNVKDAARAKRYFAQIEGKGRDDLAKTCLRKGIQVP